MLMHNPESRISHVIYHMVRGLENPTVKVRMSSYGSDKNGKLFNASGYDGVLHCGCAATNALLVDNPTAVYNYPRLAVATRYIRYAIDHVRSGGECCLEGIDDLCIELGIESDLAIEITKKFDLPELCSSYSQSQLQPYKQLADALYAVGL